MGARVTFDAVNRIIQVTAAPVAGVSSLEMLVDLYSDAKEDWRVDSDLIKHTFPFRIIGGENIGGGDVAPPFLFLQNQASAAAGWRIRPFDSGHDLTITGNLVAEDPTLPVLVPTVSGNTVLVRAQAFLAQKAGVSLAQSDLDRLVLMEKVLRNKMYTDPATGLMTLFDDDGITPLVTTSLYEDVAGTTPYSATSQHINRRDRLT